MEERIEKLEKDNRELKLALQELEKKVEALQNGEYGTGIYLGGCSEADIEYITGKVPDKKEGE